MLEEYYPYEYADSVYLIDYEKLYENGFRGLIFDVDNTLVHHGDDSNEKVDALFKQLHEIGFKTLLLSDNSEERLKRFMKNIDSLSIPLAGKPDPTSYLKALQMMNLKADQCVVIGDQIFKDILGANAAGIPSILVHFITIPGVTKIGRRRYLEFLILWVQRHSRKYSHRLGPIVRKETV